MNYQSVKIVSALLFLLIFSSCSEENDPTESDLSEDFKVVLLQPIIIKNDEGTSSFYDLDIDRLNKAYSGAEVKFTLLKQKFVTNNDMYNGTLGLGEMSDWLSGNGHFAGKNDIVNLVCTENLLGKDGSIGKGLTPGSITFIAFDPTPGSILNVFVLAHEVGHNFGLKHAVDDENVSNDLPNVMGGGEYEDRLNPENSFNSYQIDIIRSAKITHENEKALELIEQYELEEE